MSAAAIEEALTKLPVESLEEGIAHLNDALLADYLEGVLTHSEKDRFEGHLAQCSLCRDWAVHSALAVQEVAGENPSRGRYLALAASLALAIFAGWFLSLRSVSIDPSLELWGVEPKTSRQAGPEMMLWAQRSTDGQWPTPTVFESLSGAENDVVRSSSLDSLTPHLLAPRWSAVREPTPSLNWYWSVDSPTEATPVMFEIVVIDDMESLVASWILEPKEEEFAEGYFETSWPRDQIPLQSGQLYAWKVNARSGDDSLPGESWAAAEFVPFMVATQEQVLRTAERLSRVEQQPFLSAVILSAEGFYEEASLRLLWNDRLLSDDLTPQRREESVRTLLLKKKLSPTLVQLELERLKSQPCESLPAAVGKPTGTSAHE